MCVYAVIITATHRAGGFCPESEPHLNVVMGLALHKAVAWLGGCVTWQDMAVMQGHSEAHCKCIKTCNSYLPR